MSTTNPTQTELDANPVLCSERLAAIHLSHSMGVWNVKKYTSHCKTKLLKLHHHKMYIIFCLQTVKQEFNITCGFRNLCLMFFLTKKINFIPLEHGLHEVCKQ
jgi:hypothetical protein